MHKIAVIPGDGIGREVMEEALCVLEEICKANSFLTIEWEIFNWSSEYYLQHGEMMPKNGLDTLKKYDAILFGAIGDSRVPDEVSIWDLIMPIRKRFKQYINFRPIKQLAGINAPLQTEKDIDFVIIRENAEGEYSNMGGGLYQGTSQEMAVQNTVMTREGVKKASTFAFKYARSKNYKKVTSATKSNAILHTMKLWDREVSSVSSNYDDIHFESIYIDALTAYFVQRPEDFEVVLASNLFGDILSDLGSSIVGGLGVSPSANINPEGDYPSMFEPVHGSAPDIAGQGIANPIAQVWSLSLLLEHLGYEQPADAILQSIQHVIQESIVTPDLGGTCTTKQVGKAIRDQVKSNLLEAEKYESSR
ncbi:tartrate dehydrogenase [Halobacillus naozhouensis]